MTKTHPVTAYAQDVVSGKILACKKVIQACHRHIRDLQRTDIWFDEEEADRVFAFGENLKHIKGRWESPYIRLEPWQKFNLGCLFGWKVVSTGLRKYRTAYIQIARKNGKSTLAAIIGLYMLIADGEPGAEVYSAATKREQAKIVWGDAKVMVQRQPTLRKRLKCYQLNINDPLTASKFEPLGADANTLDGLNVHCGIVDELHAHKDANVWNVLETGTGSRLQPLMVAITTAGFERSVCIEKYNYCEQILSGIIEDDTMFAFVTEMDEGDDWTDPKVWLKANPNLGVSTFNHQLEPLCHRAQHVPSEQNNFLTKHLNKWCNQSERWINLDDWKANGGHYDELELLGRKCYGGLDLSSSIDITAFVLVFPPELPGEQWRAIYRFWVPHNRIEKRALGQLVDKVPYDAWERDGWIKSTPGNVLDYEFVRQEIIDLSKLYQLKEVAYDPHFAMESAIKLGEAGLNMVEFRQGARSYNEPMKRFEGMLLDRQINHGNHPAMTWMANNMVVRYDANLGMAPDKKSAKDRIDGIVAYLMALGRAILEETEPEPTIEVWEW